MGFSDSDVNLSDGVIRLLECSYQYDLQRSLIWDLTLFVFGCKFIFFLLISVGGPKSYETCSAVMVRDYEKVAYTAYLSHTSPRMTSNTSAR